MSHLAPQVAEWVESAAGETAAVKDAPDGEGEVKGAAGLLFEIQFAAV